MDGENLNEGRLDGFGLDLVGHYIRITQPACSPMKNRSIQVTRSMASGNRYELDITE